ncbi:MAG: hypothetical protein JWM05_3077 [Acidimicrobiales bacterium]|nr:hypothetical protein [Acidimicrobiales bacterium]
MAAVVASVASVAGIVGVLAPTPAAAGPTRDQAAVRNLVNGERRKVGAVELAMVWEARQKAQEWSRHMAATNRLSLSGPGPSSASPTGLHHWCEWGENVGVGPSIGDVHRKLMAQASTRNNILKRSYRSIGTGVAYGHGRVWITEIFVRYGC